MAHWDIVNVIMILDPSDIAGLGPPRTTRLSDLLGAEPYAYAFLDMPYNRKVLHVADDGTRVQQSQMGQTDQDFGGISEVTRREGRGALEEGPWFEVLIRAPSETGQQYERAVLVVNRHLEIVQVRGINTTGEILGMTKSYWNQYWKRIIRRGEYTTD